MHNELKQLPLNSPVFKQLTDLNISIEAYSRSVLSSRSTAVLPGILNYFNILKMSNERANNELVQMVHSCIQSQLDHSSDRQSFMAFFVSYFCFLSNCRVIIQPKQIQMLKKISEEISNETEVKLVTRLMGCLFAMQ